MESAKIREGFERHGIRAAGPQDGSVRRATISLISELQLGQVDGAAEQVAQLAESSLVPRFNSHPTVCLACTELPLAFPEQRMVAVFEHGRIHYINTSAAHIDAALEFAWDTDTMK